MAVKRWNVKWFFENIWHRLKNGKKFYIFLMLEMLLGSVILLVCMNVFLTEREHLKEYAKTNMSKKAAVTFSAQDYLPEEGMEEESGIVSKHITVPEREYQALVSEFEGKLAFSLSNVFIMDMFLAETGTPCTFEVYCMEDGYFTELFGIEEEAVNREKIAYLGSDVYEFLEQAGKAKKEEVFAIGYPFWIVDGRLWIDGQDLFDAVRIEEINENQIKSIPMVWTDGEYELEKAVILPLSYSADMESMIETRQEFIANTQLKVGRVNEKIDFSQLNQVLLYLTRLNENKFTFMLSDQYLELEKQYEDMKSLLVYWGWIGSAFSIMVLSGAVGVLVLLQYRRRKSTIIQYFCGATRRRLYFEMLCEIVVVLLAGTLLGSCVANKFISFLEIGGLDIKWYCQSAGMMVVLTMLIAAIAFLISYLVDKNKAYLYQIKEG